MFSAVRSPCKSSNGELELVQVGTELYARTQALMGE